MSAPKRPTAKQPRRRASASTGSIPRGRIYQNADGAKTYWLKPPGNDRNKRFYLYEKDRDSGRSKLIQDPSIDAINAQLLRGAIDETKAREMAASVRIRYQDDEERRRGYISHGSVNAQLVLDYAQARYPKGSVRDLDSARNRLFRAAAILGGVSLLTATPEQIRAKVSHLTPNYQRKVLAALKQILRHFKREDVAQALRLPKKSRRRIHHLTAADMAELNRSLDVRSGQEIGGVPAAFLQVLVNVAFHTGGRIGEIFDLEEADLFGEFVVIDSQMDRKGNRGCALKTDQGDGQERRAFVIPGGSEWLERWVSIDWKIKREMRGKRYSTILHDLSSELFPRDKQKHVVFHALRHSTAIHLVGAGVSLTLVAQSLGNSVLVCEEFYSGYSLSADGIKTMARILKS